MSRYDQQEARRDAKVLAALFLLIVIIFIVGMVWALSV